jgi:cell division protein FtsB
VRTSNSPTAILARKVRVLQKERRRLEGECEYLAEENFNLSERIQMLEDDKAKLEVQATPFKQDVSGHIIDGE